eukprot:UN21835
MRILTPLCLLANCENLARYNCTISIKYDVQNWNILFVHDVIYVVFKKSRWTHLLPFGKIGNNENFLSCTAILLLFFWEKIGAEGFIQKTTSL